MMSSELSGPSNEKTLGLDIGGTHIRSVVSDNFTYGKIEKIKSPKSYDELVKAGDTLVMIDRFDIILLEILTMRETFSHFSASECSYSIPNESNDGNEGGFSLE